MKIEQRDIIEKKIYSEIKKTEEKISKYSELCKPIAPENSIGRVSRMDAINNKSVVEAALNEARNKMFELKKTIEEIQKDSFGNCIKCKKDIAFNRLLIRPQSKLCINCAI